MCLASRRTGGVERGGAKERGRGGWRADAPTRRRPAPPAQPAPPPVEWRPRAGGGTYRPHDTSPTPPREGSLPTPQRTVDEHPHGRWRSHRAARGRAAFTAAVTHGYKGGRPCGQGWWRAWPPPPHPTPPPQSHQPLCRRPRPFCRSPPHRTSENGRQVLVAAATPAHWLVQRPPHSTELGGRGPRPLRVYRPGWG